MSTISLEPGVVVRRRCRIPERSGSRLEIAPPLVGIALRHLAAECDDLATLRRCTRTPRVPRARSRPASVSPMIASGLIVCAVTRLLLSSGWQTHQLGRGEMVETRKGETVA